MLPRSSRRTGLDCEGLETRLCLSAITFLEHDVSCCQTPGNLLAIEDLDGDGYLDLIDGLSWFKSDGAGEFSERSTLSDVYHADLTQVVGAGDLDGDRRSELFVKPYSLAGERLEVAETIQRLTSNLFSVPENIIKAIPADLDRDGDTDVVGQVVGGLEIVWFENLDGVGRFSPVKPAASGGLVDVADVDGDGQVDIVSFFGWYENQSGGDRFVEHRVVRDRFEHIELVDDLDNDGDVDLLKTEDVFRLQWLENDSSTWQPHEAVDDLILLTGTADIDGDGDQDLYGEV